MFQKKRIRVRSNNPFFLALLEATVAAEDERLWANHGEALRRYQEMRIDALFDWHLGQALRKHSIIDPDAELHALQAREYWDTSK